VTKIKKTFVNVEEKNVNSNFLPNR